MKKSMYKFYAILLTTPLLSGMESNQPSLLGNVWGWLTNSSNIHIQNPPQIATQILQTENESTRVANLLQADNLDELEFVYKDFAMWERDFSNLPYFRDDAYLVPNHSNRPQHLTYEELIKALAAFKLTMQQGLDMAQEAWAHKEAVCQEFFNLSKH